MVDTPLPTCERIARELTQLPLDQQREVWMRAVEQSETDEPTAADVRMAVTSPAIPLWWRVSELFEAKPHDVVPQAEPMSRLQRGCHQAQVFICGERR